MIVRSKPSDVEGSTIETLNESGGECTEVQVIEYYGSWTAIATQGDAKGYVPADAVQKMK